MAYGDYTLNDALRTFGLHFSLMDLFSSVPSLEPNSWLCETLEQGRHIAFFSEKSRCEFIVAPILLFCQKYLAGHCCIYSGIRLDVDPEHGLKGECDFLISQAAPSPVLQSPLLVVVEAKKNDIEEGMGQCVAQMIGVRLYNEQDKHPIDVVHGCVTTGEVWQFLRLEDTRLLVDNERYYIRDLGKILGIFVSLLRDKAVPALQGSGKGSLG